MVNLFDSFYQNHIKISKLLLLMLLWWLLLLCNGIAKGQNIIQSVNLCFEMEWHLLISSARLQLIPDDVFSVVSQVNDQPNIICTCYMHNVHVYIDVVTSLFILLVLLNFVRVSMYECVNVSFFIHCFNHFRFQLKTLQWKTIYLSLFERNINSATLNAIATKCNKNNAIAKNCINALKFMQFT